MYLKVKVLRNRADKHQDSIEGLRAQAGGLIPRLGKRDQQLVHDQIRNLDKRLSDIQNKAEKQQKAYNVLSGSLSQIKDVVDKYLSWIRDCDQQISQDDALGHKAADVEIKLSTHKGLCRDLESKQSSLDGVVQKAESLSMDLSKQEQGLVDEWIQTIQSEHSKVSENARQKEEHLEKCVVERDQFEETLRKINKWLEKKTKILQDKLHPEKFHSVDIEKQMDINKNLLKELTSFKPQIDKMTSLSQGIHASCTPEASTELTALVSDVEDRYAQLQDEASRLSKTLPEWLVTCKSVESDLMKTEMWIRDTQIKTVTPLKLDCSIETLKSLHNQYQVLSRESKEFETVVSHVDEHLAVILPGLDEGDQIVLKQQLLGLKERRNSLANLLKDNVSILEHSLDTRTQISDQVNEMEDWLGTVQEELRTLSKPVSGTAEEAKDALVRCQELKQNVLKQRGQIVALGQSVETLRSSGNRADADEILRVTSQHEMLIDQAEAQVQRCEQIVSLHNSFVDQKSVVATVLKDCGDELCAVQAQADVSVEDKMDKYKAISTRLDQAARQLVSLQDHVEQMSMRSSPEATTMLKQEIRSLESELAELRRTASNELLQCERLQRHHDDVDTNIVRTTEWLERKLASLDYKASLDMDPDRVDISIQKHRSLAEEVLRTVTETRLKLEAEKAQCLQMNEALPLKLTQRIASLENLQGRVHATILEKDKYLSEAKTDRIQFETSLRQITDWLQGAEELMELAQDGLDYENVQTQLDEHKEYFIEGSLCQDEVEQLMELSDRLNPTLDINDHETLEQSLNTIHSNVESVMKNAQKRQELLEKKADEWHNYEESLHSMNLTVQEIFDQWQNLDSGVIKNHEDARQQIKDTLTFLQRLEQHRPEINSLNEQSRDLDRFGNVASRNLIAHTIANLNERWNDVANQAENKLKSLQELDHDFINYQVVSDKMEAFISEAENLLSVTTVPEASMEISQLLDDRKVLVENLQLNEPEVTELRKQAQQLIRKLPGAEVKVHVQERMMNIIEAYNRLCETGQEHVQELQDAFDDQSGLLTELAETEVWLQEMRAELLSEDVTDGAVPPARESIEQHKLREQDVAIRMQHLHRIALTQQAKYAAQGKELPKEISIQLKQLESVESKLKESMKEREEELSHLRQDRDVFSDMHVQVQVWLEQSFTQLREPIINLDEAFVRHKALLGEFTAIKQKISLLQTKGKAILDSSPNAGEKDQTQQVMSKVLRDWTTLQNQSSQKLQELHESMALWDTIKLGSSEIYEWILRADASINVDVNVLDFSIAKQQLQEHRALSFEAEQIHRQLHNLLTKSEELAKLCDTITPRDTLLGYKQNVINVQKQLTGRLSALETVENEIINYERALAEIGDWMEQAHSELMNPPEEAELGLKKQLTSHEALILEIEQRREQATRIFEKHPELCAPGLTVLPISSNMTVEIGQMLDTAHKQAEILRDAVTQQEQYEADIKQLTQAITEAHDRIASSTVAAGNLNDLKHQISEHNVLTGEIHAYQEKVRGLNDRSQQLELHTALLLRNRDLSNSSSMASLDIGPSSFQPEKQSSRSSSQKNLFKVGLNDTTSGKMDSGVMMMTSSTMSDISSHLFSETDRSFLWDNSLTLSGNLHNSKSNLHPSMDWQAVVHSDDIDSPRTSSVPVSKHTSSISRQENIKRSTEPRGMAPSIPGVSLRSRSASPHSKSLLKPSLTIFRTDGSEEKLFSPTLSSRTPQWSVLTKRPTSTTASQEREWGASGSHPGTPREWGTGSNRPGAPTQHLTKTLPHLAMTTTMSEPNLVEAVEPSRYRTSSFGMSSSHTPVAGRLLSQDAKLIELNQSWNTLQQQLGSKERELQHALQKQERYQSALQNVTHKLETAQAKLSAPVRATSSDLEQQFVDYKDALQDLQSVKEEIVRMKERGRQISDISDPETAQSFQTTLSMVQERVTSLEAVAEEKGKQLQSSMKDREKHNIELTAYQKRVQELSDWLEVSRLEHAVTALASDSVEALHRQMQANNDIQQGVTEKLLELSDIAVQCDSLCELESGPSANKLRQELADIQTSLADFKLSAMANQNMLKGALKESEKRQKEMDEYEGSVKKLQEWLQDTKRLTLTLSPGATESTLRVSHEQQQIQQKLKNEIADHQRLIQSLTSSPHIIAPSLSPAKDPQQPQDTNNREQDLEGQWRVLSNDLAQRTMTSQETANAGEVAGQRLAHLDGTPVWATTIQYKPANQMLTRPLMSSVVTMTTQPPSELAQATPHLADIQQNLAELKHCWERLQADVDDRDIKLTETAEFQRRLHDTLMSVSSWMDTAENRLISQDTDKSPEQKYQDTENLLEEMHGLHTEITAVSGLSHQLLSNVSSERSVLIGQAIGHLTERVTSLEGQARVKETDLVKRQQASQDLQIELKQLSCDLSDLTREMETLTISPSDDDMSVSEKLDRIQIVNARLSHCKVKIETLKNRASQLSALDPHLTVTLEVLTIQTSFLELQQRVHENREDLQKFCAAQQQYSKMLDDYSEFLETAQDKLRSETISTPDKTKLDQQLLAHKNYFADLEEHRCMLESLAGQCDSNTQRQHAAQYSRLMNLTNVLQDKASLRAQKLERLAQHWSEVDRKLHEMKALCQESERALPMPVSDTDTLDGVEEKMFTFQNISSQIASEKTKMQEVVEKGKQLLHQVSCPALESEIMEFSDKWMSLNTKAAAEAKKAEKISRLWKTYESDSAVMKSWLTSATVQLAGLKNLTEKDTQSIATIRAKVDKLLEFRKDVDSQQPLKSKAIVTGDQLMRVIPQQSDTIHQSMNEIEQQWGQLLHDIGTAEEYMHQMQMDLMPSRQALNELMIWLDEIEKAVQEDKDKPMRNMVDIEDLTKKYKGYKIDLASKQLTVDFVNQTVLQASKDPTGQSEQSAEKTEFAEKLGSLNKRWQSCSGDITEQLKKLDMMREKWDEYEKAMKRLQDWFKKQEDCLKKYQLIGNEANVKQTLKDCKVLQDALNTKQDDIDSAKRLGSELTEMSKSSPKSVKYVHDKVSSVTEQYANQGEQLSRLQNLLEDVLGQWDKYHTELNALNHVISETEFCLGKYVAISSDVNTLKIQVAKLQRMQTEFDEHTGRLETFATLTNQLSQVCSGPVKQELQQGLTSIRNKWNALSGELNSRYVQWDQALQQWQHYQEEYERLGAWLDSKERLSAELMLMKDTPNLRQQCLDQSKVVQLELDSCQSQLNALKLMGQEVSRSLDAPLADIVASRQSSINQRLTSLKQLLVKHIQSLNDDLNEYKKFQEALHSVSNFLAHAENTLSLNDPDKSADDISIKRRLDQIKDISAEFTNHQQQLDSLNDLGYRMALSEAYSEKLLQLNHRWQQQSLATAEKQRRLQGLLLLTQDFPQKCENWLSFLRQVEADLSKPVSGDYKELLEQQRKADLFQSDVFSRQQVLRAIITDGQRMLQNDEVIDHVEFQHKLTTLADQWQNVVRQATLRKAVIDKLALQWQTYHALSDRLNSWLRNKDYDLQSYDFEKSSLQRIKYLLEKARSTLQDFTGHEDNYKRLHEVGKMLLERAEPSTEKEINDNLTLIQQHWYQAFGRFDGQRERLEGMVKQWQDAEDDIEDIVGWLKDVRRTLNAELPSSYDGLQRELHNCRDIETTFENSDDKRQTLMAKERQLTGTVEPADLAILHERIRLLDKQWDELQSQASLRQHRITMKLHQWSGFNERYQELCGWIDHMLIVIATRTEYHVEDLILKMQKDFQQEIENKECAKTELVAMGQQLMAASSEIRASDIEHKIGRLEEKWHHLKAVLHDRHHKLQETLVALQQLESSMANLRKWLSQMEHELGSPLIYHDCDFPEIQRKLQHQQELQRDLEKHSAGVASVLNLCEVLLHDPDACPTSVESTSLQTASRSLDKRWRNICQLVGDRRILLDETWRLWQRLTDDCKLFNSWVRDMRSQLRDPRIDQSDISKARDELIFFENLEKTIHENLRELESINKQYRKLAREGRTDNAGTLKTMMQQANDHWDALCQRITGIMHKLKQISGIRGEFDSTRESLIGWLSEIESQVVILDDSFDTMDTPAKVREVKKLQATVDRITPKTKALDQAAVYLIHQGDSTDSVDVQRKIDDFHRYQRSVLDTVYIYQTKVTKSVAMEKNRDLSLVDQEVSQAFAEAERPATMGYSVNQTLDWDMSDLEAYLESSPPDSPPEKRRATARVSPRLSSQLRTADLNLRMSREERHRRMKAGVSHIGQASRLDVLTERLADALEEAAERLISVEDTLRSQTPTGPDTDFALQDYVQLVNDCEMSIEAVQLYEQQLKQEIGVASIASIDTQVNGIIQRWEMLHDRALDKDIRLSQNRKDWAQFRIDLNNLLMWMDEAESLLESDWSESGQLCYFDTPGSKRYEDFHEEVEERRRIVHSLNLSSRSFVYNSSDETQSVRDKLRQMNGRWEDIYRKVSTVTTTTSSSSHRDLGLGGSDDFQHMVHDLLLWLESTETKLLNVEPISMTMSDATLRSKYRELLLLRDDMDAHHPQVTTLKDTADRLLQLTDTPEMALTRDKTRIISNRLRSLLRRCLSYISQIESNLKITRTSSSAYTSLDSLEHEDKTIDSGFGLSMRSSSPHSRSLRSSSPAATRRSPYSSGFYRQRKFFN